MRWFGLILFLGSCNIITHPKPQANSQIASNDCRTECGLWAAEGDCKALQKFESKYLAETSRDVLGWDRETTCHAMDGWRISLHKPYTKADTDVCALPGWLEGPKFCVIGFTHVYEKLIEIESLDWVHSSLGHELVHAVDFTTTGQVGHCAWLERGVLTALENVTGLPQQDLPCDL